jgi:hypothetical protein
MREGESGPKSSAIVFPSRVFWASRNSQRKTHPVCALVPPYRCCSSLIVCLDQLLGSWQGELCTDTCTTERHRRVSHVCVRRMCEDAATQRGKRRKEVGREFIMDLKENVGK